MRKRGLFIVIILLFVLLAGTALFLLLPTIFNHFVFPGIAEKVPFERHEIRLTKITPWQMEGSFSFGDEEEVGVAVPRFSLLYQPAGLWHKEIASLLLESAVIHLEKKAGSLILRGMQRRTGSRDEPTSFALPPLPLAVKEVIIRNSTIVFHKSETEASLLVVDGTLSPEYRVASAGESLLHSLKCDVQTSGALSATLRFTAQESTAGYDVSFAMEAAEIAKAAHLLPVTKIDELAGRLKLSGILQTEGFAAVSQYSGSAEFSSFRMRSNGIRLENTGPQSPLTLQLKGNKEKIQYQLEGAEFILPQRGALELQGEYAFQTKEVRGALTLLSPSIGTPLMVDYQGTLFNRATTLNYRLHGEPLTLGESLTIGEYTAEGHVDIEGERISGTLHAHVGEIKERENAVQLVDLTLDFPFKYPQEPTDTAGPGKFSIGKIRYQEVDSGRLEATLGTSAEMLNFSSLLTSPLHEGLRLSCRGSANMRKELVLSCSFPEMEMTSSALPPYIALPEALSFTGKIAGELDLTISDDVPSGKAQLKYSEGGVVFNGYSLSNISANLEFPELPRIRSGASQLVTIGSIDLGKINMSDAEIYLRVDDPQTLFIERVRLNWCKGKVETGGFKVSRDMEQLDATLYCDRLSFTELLGQFGVGEAEGEASLNGRLPVVIGKKGILFDDGFLFSTPGKSGIVRFKNTKQMRRGMEAMGKSAYLEYSMDALENFSYNWTMLTFNTEEEELLLSLQLDGKPTEPLPYGFTQGRIVESPKGPGLQYPVRLDVNFRLPLTELFRYGKNIQSIMENM